MARKSLTTLLAAALIISSQIQIHATEDVPEESPEVTEETTEVTEEVSNATEENPEVKEENLDTLPGDLDIEIEEPSDVEEIDMENNSISMLNYLTVLSQEITSSKNSRLFLEEAYSSIINDTYPNSVDPRTKIQLENLLDIIEEFRMIDVKRERLSYLYQQNQAQAIRSAVPNPLALLTAVNSFDLKRLIVSGIYMAIDSVTSYNAYKNQLDLQYLQEGWALDDEETKIVSENRKDAFLYMIDIVNLNHLSGEFALNEESVNELVKWKNNPNVTSRIQFLEDNEKTYREYGGYWLILASSYYEKGDYPNCLDAVRTYEEKQGKIFRIDHEFAKVLPYVIVSLQETIKNSDDRIEQIEHYIDLLINNTKNNDWALRYFAAQSYVELASETKDPLRKKDFLEKAYKVCRSNVNYLVEEQSANNSVYMAEIMEKKEPSNATKEEKKEIKAYNKLLKEERKTALPPVSEALLLNCDLLFALADEIKIDSREKQKINDILHQSNNPLFLNTVLDNAYWFDNNMEISTAEVNYDKRVLTIPASFIANDYAITVTVDDGSAVTVFDEWTIDVVDRKDKKDINTFTVRMSCEDNKQFKYKENSTVIIEIRPTQTVDCAPVVVKYKTVHKKILWIIDSIELEKVE